MTDVQLTDLSTDDLERQLRDRVERIDRLIEEAVKLRAEANERIRNLRAERAKAASMLPRTRKPKPAN